MPSTYIKYDYDRVWQSWQSTTSTGGNYYNDTIWRSWINQGTGYTTTNAKVWAYWNANSTTIRWQDEAEWAWQPITNSAITVTWSQWNTRYEETKEQKQARRLRELVAQARTDARYDRGTLEALLQQATADLADLTADQRRQIEDGFQRGIEERLEDERRREAERVAAEERKAAAAAAERKAEKLLISLLSKEQKEEWLAHKRVTEVAPSGTVWRLFPKWSGAATLMEGEVRRATLCIHPLERVPEADVMAGILVQLRGGMEDHLIGIAILHQGAFNERENEVRKKFNTEMVYDHRQRGYIRRIA